MIAIIPNATKSLPALLLLCLANSISAFAQAKIVAERSPDFYFLLQNQDGNLIEYQRDIVPNIPSHVCYGWRVKLLNVKHMVQFTEEFSLPSEPKIWTGEDDSYATNTISGDRKTSVTRKFVVPQDGWIGNEWCVAEGDPLGAYKMKISISEIPVGEINFELVSPADYHKRHTNE